MTVQQIRVAENIRLSHMKTDRFKTGILTLTLTLPLSREHSAYNQLLPALLRRGTEQFPDMAAINRRLDELYASCVEIRSSRFGKNLSLVFTAEMLDPLYVSDSTDVAGGVIDLIADMLLRPKKTDGIFERATVEQEIRFATDMLRSEINNTRSYALIRLAEMMYRADRDFPTLQQTIEDLSKIDGASLAEYHQALLRGSPLEIFYVGSLSPEKLTEKILASFGSWQGASSHRLKLPTAERSAGYLTKTEPMPVSQGKLAMGFRTGVSATDPRLYTMLMLNELFGASPASKLFLHVREEMSLCYYCSSSYNKNSGIMTVSAGIENRNRAKAEAAILHQLKEIQQGHINDNEWNAARTALENTYRQSYDNPYELQSFYGHRILFGMKDTIEDARRKLSTVTREEVITLARSIECDTVFFIEGTRTGDESEEDFDE